MVKGILIGGAAIGLVLAVIFGLAYLVSDEKGLPVPTMFAGKACWLTTKGTDVLDCRASVQGHNFFVRWKGRWSAVSRCQTQDAARVLRCRLPYPLRIDLRGDYPKVEAVIDRR